MTGAPTGDLLEELKNTEYARGYGEEIAKVDFGITMTKARKNLELTQRELADKLGVKQPYIARLERGEANPTLGAIGRLLAAINLRLITTTAPLQSEPTRASQRFVCLSAGDPTDPSLFLKFSQAESSSDWGRFFTTPVPTGTMGGTILAGSVRTETREAFVGGAAR